jgi:hypothetical protein
MSPSTKLKPLTRSRISNGVAHVGHLTAGRLTHTAGWGRFGPGRYFPLPVDFFPRNIRLAWRESAMYCYCTPGDSTPGSQRVLRDGVVFTAEIVDAEFPQLLGNVQAPTLVFIGCLRKLL